MSNKYCTVVLGARRKEKLIPPCSWDSDTLAKDLKTNKVFQVKEIGKCLRDFAFTNYDNNPCNPYLIENRLNMIAISIIKLTEKGHSVEEWLNFQRSLFSGTENEKQLVFVLNQFVTFDEERVFLTDVNFNSLKTTLQLQDDSLVKAININN